jgi:acyl-CoA synthetase (AMP-forming)/AMP-acid ligase II
MYRFFLDVRLDSPPNLAKVRYALSCTAPLDPTVVDAFHEKFGAAICQHYGSSESGAATTHVPSDVLARKESVGRAMPNVQVKVVDAGGRSLPAGTSGEVVVSGPAVALGYVMGVPPEGSPLSNGDYYTGDVGYLDGDGFLHVSGRLNQLINVGGMKVSPVEVIRVLESCPAVQEAAVIGVRDGNGDDVVYAVVTLKAPADEYQIMAHCRGRLADYKIPRRIDIRTEMPRAASGKIRIRPEDISI